MNLEKFIELLKYGNFEDQNSRIAIFDKDARFVFVSTTLFGFTENYVGMTVYEYYQGHLADSEVKKVKDCFAKALNGEPSCTQAILTNRLNKEKITWDVDFNSFVDDKGDTYVLSRIRPHEVNLTTSSTNFFIREMVEQSSDVFTVFDKDFYVVYVSKVLGKWRDESVLGLHISDLISGKALEKFYKRYKKAKENPGVVITDIVTIDMSSDDDSRNELILESSVEFHDFNQLGCYYLDRTSDVTEKVLRNREIEIQKATIDKMSKWTALGQMAANIAHEVNNPLAIIELQTQALEKRGKDLKIEQVLEKVRSIAEQKNRIANIVSSLHIYSQDDRSKRESVSLSSLIHDSIALFKTALVDEDLKIVFSNDSDNDIVMVNSSEIIQVFINLLNNAHDAILDLKDKWIEINLDDSNHKVYVDIIDSGHGIEPKLASKIFNRFYTTKGEKKGTGLGLNICQEIMNDHGGHISYVKDAEHTTFSLTFPSVELN